MPWCHQRPVPKPLWQHGGVQVLYKDRLSYVGTSREAEWKPIQCVMRSRPTMQGGQRSVAERLPAEWNRDSLVRSPAPDFP